MTRRFLLPILYAVIITQALSALNPPPGASAVDLLASSGLLLGGSAAGTSDSAAAALVNPAASALVTLPNVELAYLGLAELSSTPGYAGTGIETGLLIPGSYGVYGASARFLTSGPGAAIGTLGALNLTISKALYPTLLLGAGLGLIAGQGDSFDWGLGLNLGFISIPGSVGPFRDFSWGAAIDNIGKPFAPESAYSSFPPPFTPTVGARFSLFKRPQLNATMSASLSFPSLQDVRLGLGGNLIFGSASRLRLFGTLDLRDLLSGQQPFPLAGGIEFRLTPGGNRTPVSQLRPALAAAPIAPNLYAFGGSLSATIGRISTEPPKIVVRAPKLSYISPNGIGPKRTLQIPLTITDKNPIAGYELTVRGPGGQVVRTIHSPTLAVTATGASGILDRLLYVNAGVPVPPDLVWEGTNDRNQIVPDGSYTYTVSAWDENGNRATSAPSTVIVDTKAPRIDLTQPPGSPPIFSPNGDGYKDTLPIDQSGSKEPLWIGRFLDASGRVVRTIEWKDSSPQSFAWDGRGDGGKVLPDGVYSYVISATDLAGNSAQATIPVIVINTTRPVIALDVNRDAISPGTSSPLQTLTYRFIVPEKNLVSSWRLAIINSAGATVRSVEGRAAIPEGFTFNGSDQQGQPLPDGVYHAELSVVYRNGSDSQASAAPVTIDRVAPTATVGVEYPVFSPIGQGTRSSEIFSTTASPEPLWKGTIATGGGAIVRSFEWRERPPAKLVWDGRRADGRIAPDGVYQFWIDSTDAAGNYGQSNVVSFVLDTQHKQVLVSTDHRFFSPNGVRQVIRIIPEVRSPNGFESYRIDIENRSGKVVGSFSGTGVPTGSFAWNGLGSGGTPLPEGDYRAVMAARYSNGLTVTAATPWFTSITTLPTLTVSANYLLFSPNGDGHRDTVTFTQAGKGGGSWVGRIVAQDGKTILEHRWEGTLPATFVWNGRDSLGNIAPNGTYSYLLTARDPAGNVGQAEVSGIVLDNRPTQVYIDATSSGFSPNGDGIDDTLTLTTVEKPDTGIAAWRIAILSIAGETVKEWSGTAAPPHSLIWNGSTTSGGIAPDGSYRAELAVHYLKGDRDHAATESFLLVAHPPKVTVTLSPLPLPPPGSAEAQPLEIRISINSLDPIASWKMQIYTPPIEEPFFAFEGQGSPPSLLPWLGRSADGQAVLPDSVYSYHLTVVDSLGNKTLLTGNIPIGPAHAPPPAKKGSP